ncbi:MAG: putative xpa-binding protein 1, partial [Streblomastix strix]
MSDPTKKTPTVILFIGMAGSGKTTLVEAARKAIRKSGHKTYLINLDPAVVSVPYKPNINIQDTVNFKEAMTQYNLGPNGAILTSPWPSLLPVKNSLNEHEQELLLSAYPTYDDFKLSVFDSFRQALVPAFEHVSGIEQSSFEKISQFLLQNLDVFLILGVKRANDIQFSNAINTLRKIQADSTQMLQSFEQENNSLSQDRDEKEIDIKHIKEYDRKQQIKEKKEKPQNQQDNNEDIHLKSNIPVTILSLDMHRIEKPSPQSEDNEKTLLELPSTRISSKKVWNNKNDAPEEKEDVIDDAQYDGVAECQFCQKLFPYNDLDVHEAICDKKPRYASHHNHMDIKSEFDNHFRDFNNQFDNHLNEFPRSQLFNSNMRDNEDAIRDPFPSQHFQSHYSFTHSHNHDNSSPTQIACKFCGDMRSEVRCDSAQFHPPVREGKEQGMSREALGQHLQIQD